MQKEDLQVVRKIQLFSAMSDEHFDDMVQNAMLMRFPANAQVIWEGESADFLHIILEGTVELFGSSDERETTMLVLRCGCTYNLSAVLEDASYLMSARTLSESRILMIPGRDLRRVMEEDNAFSHAMVEELAQRYRTVIRSFKEERLRSGIERLANYLLRAHEQNRENDFIELTEDKKKLAALLGMTPEYLSRAFTALRKYEVLVKGNRITLNNVDALTQFAKPNPLIDRLST